MTDFASEHSIQYLDIAANICGGLALLLYGISRMSSSVKAIAGDQMADYLTRLSRTPLRGFASGVIGAGAMQSSTAIVLLLLSFVSSSYMTFEQSVAVLLGAQIGTTFVNQLGKLHLLFVMQRKLCIFMHSHVSQLLSSCRRTHCYCSQPALAASNFPKTTQ